MSELYPINLSSPPDLKFIIGSKIKDMQKHEYHYCLFFGNYSLNIETHWRLLKNNSFLWGIVDDGQIYGLKKAIDVSKKVLKELKDKKITKVEFKNNIGDLIINIEEIYEFQILNFSVAFDPWELYSNSGELEMWVGSNRDEILYYKE